MYWKIPLALKFFIFKWVEKPDTWVCVIVVLNIEDYDVKMILTQTTHVPNQPAVTDTL